MPTSSPSARRANAVQSFRSAAEAIGPILPGLSLFAVTRGQWSMIDALLHVLDQLGPSQISLWTWTVAEYEVQTLARLRRDEHVIAGRLVIDAGARQKNAAIIAEWKRAFGPDAVRYVVNHAKIATVESASGLRVLMRGSMNLNFNPRFEHFDLTEGGPDFDLVREIENTLPVLPDECSGKDAYAASRVADAFDATTLSAFQHLKIWAK